MFLLRMNPQITDRWGYHVRPIHYYEPVPDFRTISSADLERRRVPAGLSIDLSAQVRRVESFAQRFAGELRDLHRQGPKGFDFENEYFSGLDAAIYYSIIRDLRPARIIEIGAGYSTQIAAKAMDANRRYGRGEAILTVIEPYPQARLMDSGVKFQLIARPVEKVDPALFQSLVANDILFIDSSHALRCGGDVFVEFLEILPRLKPGVWVHIHDIFLPFDYPVDWVLGKRLAFNEQYLLEAFLTFNERFSVQLANCWLATDHIDSTNLLIPGGKSAGAGACPGSFWIRRGN